MNHKKKTRGRKARKFCFRKTSFVHSRSETYYALLHGCFGLKFLPDVHRRVYWVLGEIWAPDLFHKNDNKFLSITARAESKVRLCVKLFDFFVGKYSSVWPEICRILSRIQWRFLRGISGKNISGEFFRNFRANQGYPLPKLVTFLPTFCYFYSASVLRSKNSHKYFHVFFAPK